MEKLLEHYTTPPDATPPTYRVDTQNAGFDCEICAGSAESALSASRWRRERVER